MTGSTLIPRCWHLSAWPSPSTLIAPRGLWGFAADRFGWSLLPVGYRVRHAARMTANRPLG